MQPTFLAKANSHVMVTMRHSLLLVIEAWVRGINPFAEQCVYKKTMMDIGRLGHRIIVHQKFYSNEIKSFTQHRDPKINGKKGAKKTTNSI